MAKAPDARHPSMAAFRRDLEALLPAPATWTPRSAGVTAAAAAAAFVAAAGFVASQALDQGLGRVTEFRIASLATWFYWGIRSLVAPAVFALVLLLGFLVVTSAVGLSWKIAFVRALLDPVAAPVRTAIVRLASLPAATIAQIVLLAHVAVLAVLWVYFQPLLAGIMHFMMALPQPIDALSPANSDMHERFGYFVTSALLVFSVAWYRVVRVRARREREGLVVVVAGVAALVLSGLLFTARFRILAHNESERVAYRSEACYLVEDRGATALLFCPLAYPRNVVAPVSEVVRTGNIENIFLLLNPR
jgi:hypothetical protein